jgi:hypothetical protein
MYTKVIFIAFTIGLLSFTACKKKNTDYRDPYIGSWSFHVDRTEINTDSIGYYFHDSLTYPGNIEPGEASDGIIIHYTADNSIPLTIAADGTLSGFPTHYCGGEFKGQNNIHLYLRWGGLGGGTTHVIDGVKK